MKGLNLFLNSFKINKRFIYVFLVELIFLLVIFASAVGWLGVLNAKSIAVTNSLSVMSDGNELLGLTSLVNHFKVFFFFLVVLTTAFILILLFGFSLARNLVWNKLFNKSFKIRKYLKFTLLNFVWFVVWIPIMIIFMFPLFALSSAFQTNPNLGFFYSVMVYVNLLLFLIIAYFGMFAYRSFLHHKKIYRALTESFKQGIKFLPKLLFPCLLACLLVGISFILLFSVSSIILKVLFFVLLLYLFTSFRIYIVRKLI